MNKLIKELALISGFDIDNTSSFAEKTRLDCFTQLLINQCLEACNRANEIRHFVPPTQQQVVLSCMDEIDRTFRN